MNATTTNKRTDSSALLYRLFYFSALLYTAHALSGTLDNVAPFCGFEIFLANSTMLASLRELAKDYRRVKVSYRSLRAACGEDGIFVDKELPRHLDDMRYSSDYWKRVLNGLSTQNQSCSAKNTFPRAVQRILNTLERNRVTIVGNSKDESDNLNYRYPWESPLLLDYLNRCSLRLEKTTQALFRLFSRATKSLVFSFYNDLLQILTAKRFELCHFNELLAYSKLHEQELTTAMNIFACCGYAYGLDATTASSLVPRRIYRFWKLTKVMSAHQIYHVPARLNCNTIGVIYNSQFQDALDAALEWPRLKLCSEFQSAAASVLAEATRRVSFGTDFMPWYILHTEFQAAITTIFFEMELYKTQSQKCSKSEWTISDNSDGVRDISAKEWALMHKKTVSFRLNEAHAAMSNLQRAIALSQPELCFCHAYSTKIIEEFTVNLYPPETSSKMEFHNFIKLKEFVRNKYGVFTVPFCDDAAILLTEFGRLHWSILSYFRLKNSIF